MKPILLELNQITEVKIVKLRGHIITDKVMINLNELSHFHPYSIEATDLYGTKLYLHNSIIEVVEPYDKIKAAVAHYQLYPADYQPPKNNI